MSRRLKRRKQDTGKNREKPEQPEGNTTENLDNTVNPFKRIFPWDFPGQNGDWTKKNRS